MAHVWQNLLFAHWPVPVSVMQPLIPAPLVSRFPEMNVRMYVICEDKPGILFFSLMPPTR